MNTIHVTNLRLEALVKSGKSPERLSSFPQSDKKDKVTFSTQFSTHTTHNPKQTPEREPCPTRSVSVAITSIPSATCREFKAFTLAVFVDVVAW